MKKASLRQTKMNNHLTRAKKHLLWLCKQKARQSIWKFVWERDGNIIIRKNENERSMLINSIDDLNSLYMICMCYAFLCVPIVRVIMLSNTINSLYLNIQSIRSNWDIFLCRRYQFVRYYNFS